MPKRGTNPHPSRSNRFILVPCSPRQPTTGHRPLATAHRPLATAHRPLATDHWPLPTVHYPLSTAVPQSAPAVPCKSLRNVLYCKAGPECAASHNCPPTLPRPPTMPTHSERHVLTLSPSHIAPGLAATSPKCTTRPPMPAPPPPASVSCHEKDATVTVLRPFCTKTTLFAHFLSKNDKELTATASCYESPCQYPVTRRENFFSKLDQSGQNSAFDTLSIPSRYPVSEKLAAPLRHIRTPPGQCQTESAPLLRTCAALPTRRPTPPLTSTLTSTLISARAGEVARDQVLHSKKARAEGAGPAGALHGVIRTATGSPRRRPRNAWRPNQARLSDSPG